VYGRRLTLTGLNITGLNITGVTLRLWAALGMWWAWMHAMGFLVGVILTVSQVRIDE
jgi:hypothetical protein